MSANCESYREKGIIFHTYHEKIGSATLMKNIASPMKDPPRESLPAR
jgi:hypothetical protein